MFSFSSPEREKLLDLAQKSVKVISMIEETVTPFEESDPKLANSLAEIIGGRSTIRGFDISVHRNIYMLRSGQMIVKNQNPNNVCRCGSGRKYKKCCGK